MRRALVLATRLAGTDGVSLESAKLVQVLARLGWESVACAGEVDDPAAIELPAMHFRDPTAEALGRRAFGGEDPDPDLERDLEEAAHALLDDLLGVVARVRPELLVVQNAWAIPMQLPLARALAGLADRTALPVVSHEHDYWWERERFAVSRVRDDLARFFPYHRPGVAHLSINSAAARALRRRRGLEPLLLPNVMDFDAPPPGVDAVNADFRAEAGLSPGDRLVLQPTRVVPRKGIELAVELLARLGDPRNVLVVSHAAGDEGYDTLRALERQASARDVRLHYLGDRIADRRARDPDGRLRYALADAYAHADLVTYPSLYEGFGNALLETIWFRLPAFVNRYPVYREDIAPKGFRFVEIDGRVDDRAVAAVARLLEHPEEVDAMTSHNLALARRHFGLDTMERVAREALREVGAST